MEKACNNISQLFQYSGMNPIRLHILMCIQLEQQLLNKFSISWKFVISPAMVLKHRAAEATTGIKVKT